MKKISTLAVALMTLGSLVTPAQADVVSTETLPSGYYKITSAAADRTRKNVFNDFSVSGNVNNVTLVGVAEGNTNNYIWHITNDGTSTTIGIVNGQGTPITREDGNHGALGVKSYSTLTPKNVTSLESILFGEYLHNPGNTDGNHTYGDYMGVAVYNGFTGDNTRWNLTKVDVDAKAYTVSVVTTSTSTTKPYITRTLADGTKEYAFNSGFFISDANLEETSLTASTLEGYETPNITVDNTAKTITAYYAKFDDLTALITSATKLLNTRGIGYPLSASTAHIQLAAVIDAASCITAASSAKECAEAYTHLQNAITNYRSTKTDIQLPEDGKVYRIYAKWADETKVYAVNDGKSVETGYYVSGSTTTREDKSDLWVVQKDGAAFKFASAKADRLFIYKDQKGKASTVDFYMTLSRLSGLGVLNITTDNAFTTNICMKKDGDCTGQYTRSGTAYNGTWSTEWFFEEVPTSEFAGQTVNFAASADGHCYATLNLPYASTLPEGVTAYTATVEGTTVNLTEYKTAGSVLPANTPVLLTATSEGSKTFAPAAYVAAEGTGFKGTLAATAVTDANVYILSMGSGKTVKFFALDETNNTINANKAYLVVPGGKAQALNFNFGNTTGIQNAAVEGVNANAPLFDLSGRRVVKAVKGGIYIQNGKKFVK